MFVENLDEIINVVNSNSKDLSDVNLKISSIQNTILDLKSQSLENQLAKISELANSTSNSPKGAGELRLLIEEISNITLERQQLSNDKLAHKLHEMQFEIDKMKIKFEDSLAIGLPNEISRSSWEIVKN